MNALVKGEYDKLTPFQKAKFDELVAWQATTCKGTHTPMDNAYFKILEWAKNIPEPTPIVEIKTEE